MTADIRFHWDAERPDEVTILVQGDNEWHPVLDCDIADFDAQWAAVKAEKWAQEMRQEADRLRTTDARQIMADARKRRDESSRRFETARFGE